MGDNVDETVSPHGYSLVVDLYVLFNLFMMTILGR